MNLYLHYAGIHTALSKRMLNLKESGTLKMIEKVRELQRKGIKVIQLDVGEPDFDTPAPIIDAAEEAMRSGFTHYTPSAGIPELREAVAEKLRRENRLEVGKEDVIVTPGSKQALFYAVMALVGEGDEVVIPTPAWVSYMEMVALAGGRVREVPAKEGFRPDIEAVKEAVTPRTRLIMLNSPNNPTGCVYSEGELRALAEVSRGAYIISDEIYEKILYEGSHFSIGSIPGVGDRTITVNGFSKTYAMTGWRLGYAAGPREVISAMNKIQQHSASSPASFTQKAALAAFSTDPSPMVAEFRARRDYVCGELCRLGFDLGPEKPHGAFYAFPKIGTGMGGAEFCDLLLAEAGVSATAGEAFGDYPSHVRISYANSMDRLEEAIARIGSFLERHGK